MRIHTIWWAPDDRARPGRRGAAPSTPNQKSPRADREMPPTESGPTPTEPPSDAAEGGRRTSGPGPNDLTRGLP